MPDEIKNFNSADYTDEFIRSLYTKNGKIIIIHIFDLKITILPEFY